MDKIDQAILSALYQDGRLTNIRLAQQLGINKTTVGRKKERMLSENLFVIRAVPNPFKIIHKARACLLLSVELTEVKDVCVKLVNNPRIITLLTTFGEFNIFVYLEFPEWELLIDFIKKYISTIYGLKDLKINLISEVRKRSWHFFTSDRNYDSEPLKLDEKDHRLVDELCENGTVKYPYLAKKLNTSSATISRRITSLISREIVKIVAVPNPAKLDSHISSIIQIHIEKDKLNQICAELFKNSEVHTIMISISNLDIIIRASFPTSGKMHEFISEKLVYIDGVLRVNPYVRAEIKKILYSPDI
jgi:Lrp/AsnC family transcriptional regulator for asnA, asnC and gidA